MGNKRNMLKHIKVVLETMQEDGQINSETIFIDCFGGERAYLSQYKAVVS